MQPIPHFEAKKIIIKLLDQTLVLACRSAYVDVQQMKLGILNLNIEKLPPMVNRYNHGNTVN